MCHTCTGTGHQPLKPAQTLSTPQSASAGSLAVHQGEASNSGTGQRYMPSRQPRNLTGQRRYTAVNMQQRPAVQTVVHSGTGQRYGALIMRRCSVVQTAVHSGTGRRYTALSMRRRSAVPARQLGPLGLCDGWQHEGQGRPQAVGAAENLARAGAGGGGRHRGCEGLHEEMQDSGRNTHRG